MAHHKSALKRIRQDVKRSERNKGVKSRMRTYVKKTEEQITAGKLDEAQKALREAISVIAKTAKQGVIHKNQASRRISRLNAQVKALAAA